jgi:hypothetical protein
MVPGPIETIEQRTSRDRSGEKMAEYRVNDRMVSDQDSDFESMLESVYKTASRPLCLCSDPGIEMQIAKINEHYVIKRMPDTGTNHSPQCVSFETPPELSGLGDLMGTAIQEENGVTVLKFDFPLSRMAEKSSVKEPDEKEKESVKAPSKRLSLRGLLHYLWQDAGLTRWHPTIKKRTWSDVYKQILCSMDNKQANAARVKEFLYLPEPCTPENMMAVVGQRCSTWSKFRLNHPKQLMLLVGEVAREGITGACGGAISVEEIRDTHLLLGEGVYKSILHSFANELDLWRLSATTKLIMAATVSLSAHLVASLEQMTFMAVTEEWIPFETSPERDLIFSLLKNRRSFEKIMRYNFARDFPMANFLLLDTSPTQTEMFVIRESKNLVDYRIGVDAAIQNTKNSTWRWDPFEDKMPEFPDSIMGNSVTSRQAIRAVM